jgi:FAD/FMN-containing dehydrogenase
LRGIDVGEVRFSRHDRQLYSTDASLYQVEPLGVVIPGTVDQAGRLVAFCRQNKLPILPRGGGTSLAGQCTGRAVVMDLSPGFRRVSEIDVQQRRCRAEAGVVLEQLNRELLARGSGLFFAPDPATIAQAGDASAIMRRARGPFDMVEPVKMLPAWMCCWPVASGRG